MKKNEKLIWQPEYASFPVNSEVYEEKIEYMDSITNIGDFIRDCLCCIIENNSEGKIVIKKIVKK